MKTLRYWRRYVRWWFASPPYPVLELARIGANSPRSAYYDSPPALLLRQRWRRDTLEWVSQKPRRDDP